MTSGMDYTGSIRYRYYTLNKVFQEPNLKLSAVYIVQVHLKIARLRLKQY